jgi:hypothetical protein
MLTHTEWRTGPCDWRLRPCLHLRRLAIVTSRRYIHPGPRKRKNPYLSHLSVAFFCPAFKGVEYKGSEPFYDVLAVDWLP